MGKELVNVQMMLISKGYYKEEGLNAEYIKRLTKHFESEELKLNPDKIQEEEVPDDQKALANTFIPDPDQ